MRIRNRIRIAIICTVLVIINCVCQVTVQAANNTVNLYGVHDEDKQNRWFWMDDIRTAFDSYASFTTKQNNYFSKKSLITGIDQSRVFIIHTHGVDDGDQLECRVQFWMLLLMRC